MAKAHRLQPSESSPLFHPESLFVVYPKRWYILTVFSLCTFWQGAIWLTFSSIPTVTEQYYFGISDATVDLLLSWGPIAFIPAVFLVMYLDARLNSFRVVVLLGIALAFVGSLIRCIPFWLPDSMRWYAVYFLHAGQILNGMSGACLFAMPSRLSVLWFGSNQRVLATAIASLSNSFASVGFLLGPLIVPTVAQLPWFLYGECAVAALLLLVVMVHYPTAPPSPPSPAAASLEVRVCFALLAFACLLARVCARCGMGRVAMRLSLRSARLCGRKPSNSSSRWCTPLTLGCVDVCACECDAAYTHAGANGHAGVCARRAEDHPQSALRHLGHCRRTPRRYVGHTYRYTR